MTIQNRIIGETSKLKILMIFDGPIGRKDASVVHVFELFHNLMRLTEVCLFVSKPRNQSVKEKNVVYIPVLWIPNLTAISFQIMVFFYLFKYCLKFSPDILYSRFSKFAFVPVIISKLFNIPLIVEMNGLVQEEIKITSKSKIELFFTRISEKMNCIYARHIIAVTPNIMKYIQERYHQTNISVVSNGANIDLFKPMNQKEVKSHLLLSADKRYIGFIGSLERWQGIDNLIFSAPYVIELFPDVQFLIVGDGPMKNELIELIQTLKLEDNFLMIGSVPYETVPLYINSCEFCVAPKNPLKSGYSPLKLYEYLACGKPVIATRTEGLDILETFRMGALVYTKNHRDFAESIIDLLQNEKKRNEMGERGRGYIEDHHSWFRVAEKIYGICQGINNQIKTINPEKRGLKYLKI